jgi:spore germination cell wall hydrolase CwlJ-like protein
MWRESLGYLSDRREWILGSGAAVALLCGIWVLAKPAALNYVNWRNQDVYISVARPTLPNAGVNAERLAQANALVAPSALEQLSPAQAQAVNATAPFSTLPNPPAKPFRFESDNPLDRARALSCLTMAVYYEAGDQGPDGEAAVAQVVLNRLRHPLFPKTVCGVVFEGAALPTGCQFTFSCDGSLGRRPREAAWKEASQVAERALDGYVQRDVGEATHYHTVWVAPYWRSSVVKLTQIGAHIFYRWPGRLGAPAAFQGRYLGSEAAPPLIKGFGAAPPPILVTKVDIPPVPTAAPIALAPPDVPVQVAMLTIGAPSAAPIGPFGPPAGKPKDFLGRGAGSAQPPARARAFVAVPSRH